MVTTDVNELTEAIDTLRTFANEAAESGSLESFGCVEQQINRLESLVRSLRFALRSTEAKRAANKLEDGDALTEDDFAVVRELLIADAKHAVSDEASHNKRVSQFSDILEAVTRHAQETLEPERIAELHETITDACRLVPEIRRHLEEKRRIEKFEASLQSLDLATRQMLAQILRERVADSVS